MFVAYAFRVTVNTVKLKSFLSIFLSISWISLPISAMPNDNYEEENQYDEFEFGRTLSEFLKPKKPDSLYQVQLAEKAGIDPTVLSRMMNGDRVTGKFRERVVLIIKALQDEGILQNIDEANNLLEKANLAPLSVEDSIEAEIIQRFEAKSEEPTIIREGPSVKYEVEPEVPTEPDQITEVSSEASLLQQLWANRKLRYAVIGIIVLVAVSAFIFRVRPSIITWWELRQIAGVQISRLPQNGQVFYSTSFDDIVGSEWSTSSIAEAANGEKFLGEFGVDDEVTLRFENLGPHESVVINFDLYIIRSWDGNHEEDYIFEGRAYRVGPDFWGMKSDGQLLMKTTFSNNMGQNGIVYLQAFPDNYGRSSYSPGANARDVNSLGYTYVGFPMDATYEIILEFEHDGPELNLSFFSDAVELREVARGFESFNTIHNESWGIDNLQVILVEE